MKPATPWWDKWPERLEYETRSLEALGIASERDEESYRAGVLKLRLEVPQDDGSLDLVVVYPDSFPYFRCEIFAPSLDLAHHQNPFEKNLCLMGRRSHYWDTGMSAADLIRDRLPLVLRAGRAVDLEEVVGLEQQQAEPLGNYYSCIPESMVIVQSDWTIPRQHTYGRFIIGTQTQTDRRPQVCLRGAVLEVRDADNKVLIQANEALKLAYAGKSIEGCWVRVSEPYRERNHVEIIKNFTNLYPFAAQARPNHVENNGSSAWLQVWGVVFPEETGWREMGEGWLFVSALYDKRPSARLVKVPRRKAKRRSQK